MGEPDVPFFDTDADLSGASIRSLQGAAVSRDVAQILRTEDLDASPASGDAPGGRGPWMARVNPPAHMLLTLCTFHEKAVPPSLFGKQVSEKIDSGHPWPSPFGHVIPIGSHQV